MLEYFKDQADKQQTKYFYILNTIVEDLAEIQMLSIKPDELEKLDGLEFAGFNDNTKTQIPRFQDSKFAEYQLKRFKSKLSTRENIEQITAVMRDDSDYAWSWHCNLAMSFLDAGGVSHQTANIGAANFMYTLFGIDITKFENYKEFQEHWDKDAAHLK